MRILLSNDDGILAPGLAALYAAVADMGEVSVVAPDSPQSAAGHAITLHHPLSVRPVRVDAPVEFSGVSVDGRPADCVRLAVRKLLPQPPDLVLSGINAGSNVGVNVFYSGTVAAAAEAAMCGIPAVAFSAKLGDEVDFARVAGYCRKVLERIIADGPAKGDLTNVNIPDLSAGPPRGVRVVPQSTAGLDDEYHRHLDEAGRESYRLAADYGFLPSHGISDVVCLAERFITVTPLKVDMTDHSRLDRMASSDWPDAFQ